MNLLSMFTVQYGITRLMDLLILFSFLAVIVLSLVWLERKALGRLQLRLGPTRTGPFGLLQPIADAVKLVLKEDIIPNESERVIFWMAPIIVVISSFMLWVTIPFTPDIVVENLENMGLFYIGAVGVLGILGLVLAGWGSANKYGVIGGLRAAAQLISYEIPLIMILVSIAILTQTFNLIEIVNLQHPVPFALIHPLALVVFFVAGLAEVGRTPFDIYFAESEIVGGPFVEYSGAHWAVFFLSEYINTFAIATLTVLLFLGGWAGPILPGIVWLLLKVYIVILVIFWIRGSLPRLRIDQLMAFAWKVMVPLSFYSVLVSAVCVFYGFPWWVLSIMSIVGLGVVGYVIHRHITAPAKKVAEVIARLQISENK
jgi:NADH-quinone oxidoreductase subunit H